VAEGGAFALLKEISDEQWHPHPADPFPVRVQDVRDLDDRSGPVPRHPVPGAPQAALRLQTPLARRLASNSGASSQLACLGVSVSDFSHCVLR
jgi:hypothetical protein